MLWQELGVLAIVAAAVFYLGRKLFARPRMKTPTSFVPLTSLKKRKP